VDLAAIRQRHEREALRGIGPLHRSARSAARQQAVSDADAEIKAALALAQGAQAQLQRDLDLQWQRLLANDHQVVIGTLAEAFEDNEAPAVVAGVEGSEITRVVLVPSTDSVPERMPSTTEAGNLSLRKMTKTQRNAFYLELVCGHLLVTVRESLAVAPGVASARVVAVRWSPVNSYGRRDLECLLAVVLTRQSLEGIQWKTASARAIVADAGTNILMNQGLASELRQLDLHMSRHWLP
jgi:hypothetical protein